MAGQIGDQLAPTYCNVVLLVGADRWVEPCFSMTHLAQAFTLQSSGDVLLVDGDLRFGRLSNSVARPGPGMIEAMLGQAPWPDIIHPTNLARIDFVACGNAQVPTVERPNFGWGALRPLYRAVLIGLAGHSEPETTWLAARCDAVYLVLSRPHTRRGSASAAINALRACGANVAGSIVVNDCALAAVRIESTHWHRQFAGPNTQAQFRRGSLDAHMSGDRRRGFHRFARGPGALRAGRSGARAG